jgi:hypothetical protein
MTRSVEPLVAGARLGPLTVELRLAGAELEVIGAGGGRLDPGAAEVLIALGGPAPSWLAAVDALTRVGRAVPGDIGAVCRAAAAIDAGGQERAVLARTSDDRAILIGLAAYGQYQVGANARCDTQIWDLVRYHPNELVRSQALRQNEVLPPALGGHRDVETRRRVAANPACPPELLRSLVTGEPPVRAAVAANAACPSLTLLGMSRSDDVWVRKAVAANPACPVKAFRRLMWDRQAIVRNALLLNPAVPTHLAARQVYQDPTPAVRAALAGRIDLPGSTLGWLERYARRDSPQQYKLVRQRIAAHPNFPDRLRERLEQIDARIARIEEQRRQGKRSRVSAAAVPVLVCAVAAIVEFLAAVVIAAGDADGGGSGIAAVVIGSAVSIGAAFGTVALLRRRAPYLNWRPPYLRLRHRRRLASVLLLLLLFAAPVVAAAAAAPAVVLPVMAAIVIGLRLRVRRHRRLMQRQSG